jgi:regulator of sigma E protease
MVSIIGAILAIGLLILVHEAGHYFVARWCKMRVERFSIGFGPGLLRWRRGDTEFQLAPLPFGGFVQIDGMMVADEVDPDDPHAYPNRPVWQRFLTIFAGPGTNYLFAVLLALGLYAIAGVPTGTTWYEVASVASDFDAHGKLQPGDRIVALDGKRIYLAYEGELQEPLQSLLQKTKERPVAITVLRDGKELTVPVAPKLDPDNKTPEGEPQYRLGVSLSFPDELVPVGPLGAAGAALEYPVVQTSRLLEGLWDIVTGREKGELTGPVGITSMIKRSFDSGWIQVVELLMMLNVYLGLFNLLPLPALDGGRLVFLGYEMATRRRANPKVEATVHMVGIMALLLLMVVVTFKDIKKLF